MNVKDIISKSKPKHKLFETPYPDGAAIYRAFPELKGMVLAPDRDPAFPIYANIYGMQELGFISPYTPGRVIWAVAVDDLSDGGHMAEGLLEQVTQSDIVAVPLYQGNYEGEFGNWHVDDPGVKLAAYDQNIEFIKEIAPKCAGVLIGNCYSEVTYEFEYVAKGLGHCLKATNSLCQFLEATASIVIEAGGRPVYAPRWWDILTDCYQGKSKFLNKCNEIEALLIAFEGYLTFSPDLNKFEDTSYPMLSSYIAAANEMWCGVDMMFGYVNGADIALQARGFDAGIMGPWPNLGGFYYVLQNEAIPPDHDEIDEDAV